jgi:hypothetical protein
MLTRTGREQDERLQRFRASSVRPAASGAGAMARTPATGRRRGGSCCGGYRVSSWTAWAGLPGRAKPGRRQDRHRPGGPGHAGAGRRRAGISSTAAGACNLAARRGGRVGGGCGSMAIWAACSSSGTAGMQARAMKSWAPERSGADQEPAEALGNRAGPCP